MSARTIKHFNKVIAPKLKRGRRIQANVTVRVVPWANLTPRDAARAIEEILLARSSYFTDIKVKVLKEKK